MFYAQRQPPPTTYNFFLVFLCLSLFLTEYFSKNNVHITTFQKVDFSFGQNIKKLFFYFFECVYVYYHTHIRIYKSYKFIIINVNLSHEFVTQQGRKKNTKFPVQMHFFSACRHLTDGRTAATYPRRQPDSLSIRPTVAHQDEPSRPATT